MVSRRTTWGFLLAALLCASPAVGIQNQGGLKPSKVPPPPLPEIGAGKPETSTPSDPGRGDTAVPRSEAEDRVVPDAGGSTWRKWLARNFHSFEPPPLDVGGTHPGLLPDLVDPAMIAAKRALYEPEVDARLSLLMKDPDDRVRGTAAIALARAGLADDPNDATEILKLLSDDQRRVRDQALLAAALAEGTATRYHLLRLAAAQEELASAPNDSERVRLRVLATLFASLRGEASLSQFVRDLVTDRRLATPLRALVVQAVGLAGNADAAELLVGIARERAEPALVRAAAVAALGALTHRAAGPMIVALLEDRDHDSEVRASAALAVGQLVTAAETDLVRTLVRAHDREGNATVARFLLLSLGRIGGPLAELEIERVMLRESAEERVFAELALGMVARASGSVQKLTVLLDALRTVRIQDERCALLCALGLSGMAQAYEAIANETLKAGAPEVRRAGIVALGILGRPECLPLFQKLLLDDAAPDVRVQAARALARLDPGSYSTLIHALSSSRSRGTSERAALILCLGFTRDPATIDPLLSLLREPGHSSQEREAATTALGLVYDPHRAPPMARVGEAKSFLRESAEIPALLALTE